VAVPVTAILLALSGLVLRLARWASAAVPFRVPTTCGQQSSLRWLRAAPLDNPPNRAWAATRLGLEILSFRSLFGNTSALLAGENPRRLVVLERKLLWAAALAFHYSLAAVAIRHLRFFVEPVPAFVAALARLDGFFEATTPVFYATDAVLLASLAWLIWRRLADPVVRYLSLFTDYFSLFVISGLALSGVLMRHVWRTDVAGAKKWAMGLVTLGPDSAAAPGGLFMVHVCMGFVLVGWLPWGKLAHSFGAFLNPTRGLVNDTRRRRHVNPWNRPLPVRTYAEWEDEFKDRIAAAGIPLDGEERNA
jgi:nitrate reductase gamma subunit